MMSIEDARYEYLYLVSQMKPGPRQITSKQLSNALNLNLMISRMHKLIEFLSTNDPNFSDIHMTTMSSLSGSPKDIMLNRLRAKLEARKQKNIQ